MNVRFQKTLSRIAALTLSLLLLAVLVLPANSFAQGTGEVVRVGWFESPFNTTDELGRRSGYAYDYQQKLAAYTGWTYEYVEGSWSQLLQMLKDGKIDLLSDVSYTEERGSEMLFSSLPMGAEEYYLYVKAGNDEISAEDFSTFNGKKVGVNQGSIQIDLFHDWEAANGVEAELVELTGKEEDNFGKLTRGEIDMYLSLDGFVKTEEAVPICMIGESDFYFAVNNSRPDLLTELNNAMNRVHDELPNYGQLLYSKYLKSSNVNQFLSSEELDWLEKHGPVRIGYQDNYLAFCAKDPKTGQLDGALADYLDVASDCLENAHIDFEAVCYPTSAEAIEAMQSGEVDCVFPVNLTAYDGETRGVFVTPAIMRTDMSAIIRESDKDDFAKKDRITVAVNAGNPNYDMFLLDHFPEWRPIYFENTQECLKAVAEGRADCLLVSNYRYNNIADECEKNHLTTWSTGVEMDYCLAVNRDNTTLYSILSKIAGEVPESTVNASLTYNYSEDSAASFQNQKNQTLTIVIIILAVVIVVLIVLLILLWRKKKKMTGSM